MSTTPMPPISSPPQRNYEDHTPNNPKAPKDISGPMLLSKPNPIVPKGYRQPNFESPSGSPQASIGSSASAEYLPGRRPAPLVTSAPQAKKPQAQSADPIPKFTSAPFSNVGSGYSSGPSRTGMKTCLNCNSQWGTSVTYCGNCGNRV